MNSEEVEAAKEKRKMNDSPLMIKSKELALEVVAFERQQIFPKKRQNKKIQFAVLGLSTGIGLVKASKT